MPNIDQSHSKIVKMPRFHESTHPSEIWFEAGVVYYRDMSEPEEVRTATVYDFEERINALEDLLGDGDGVFAEQITCSKQDVQRFLSDARELITEAKRQLHVGLPIETISEVERSRAPVSARSGFAGTPILQSELGTFAERSSGLLVPTK